MQHWPRAVVVPRRTTLLTLVSAVGLQVLSPPPKALAQERLALVVTDPAGDTTVLHMVRTVREWRCATGIDRTLFINANTATHAVSTTLPLWVRNVRLEVPFAAIRRIRTGGSIPPGASPLHGPAWMAREYTLELAGGLTLSGYVETRDLLLRGERGGLNAPVEVGAERIREVLITEEPTEVRSQGQGPFTVAVVDAADSAEIQDATLFYQRRNPNGCPIGDFQTTAIEMVLNKPPGRVRAITLEDVQEVTFVPPADCASCGREIRLTLVGGAVVQGRLSDPQDITGVVRLGSNIVEAHIPLASVAPLRILLRPYVFLRSLKGTWSVTFAVDQTMTGRDRRVAAPTSGTITLGDTVTVLRVATTYKGLSARLAVDFTRLLGRRLPCLASPDTGVVVEARGDTITVDLTPSGYQCGFSLTGRLDNDTLSGTWIASGRVPQAVGHFVMVRAPAPSGLPR